MKEYPLFINGKISAIIHKPKLKQPFVVFCHGFKGNKLGSYNLYVTMARELAKQGIGSVRFDFQGSGDSAGKFEDISIKQELNDLDAICKYIRRQGYCSSVALLGHSLGGTVAALYAAKCQLPAVLLAPAVDRSKALDRYRAEDRVKEVKGFYIVDGWRVNKKFLTDSLELYSTAHEIKSAVLLIQGTLDKSCSFEDSQKFFSGLAGRKKWITLEGSDHLFSNPSHREQIIREATKWLKSAFSAR